MGGPFCFWREERRAVRFFVNHWKLNSVAERNSYRLPRINECIDSLGDATTHSPLNTNEGYLQIEVEEVNGGKKVFNSQCWLIRFGITSVGLGNALRTCQQRMDVMLFSGKWQHALVYLDDVVVFPTHLLSITDMFDLWWLCCKTLAEP